MSRECFECGRLINRDGVSEIIFEDVARFHVRCHAEFLARQPKRPAPPRTGSRWDRSTKAARSVGRGDKSAGRSFAAKGRLA